MKFRSGVLLSADIEAVRNGQWPETRQLKVSTPMRELPITSRCKRIRLRRYTDIFLYSRLKRKEKEKKTHTHTFSNKPYLASRIYLKKSLFAERSRALMMTFDVSQCYMYCLWEQFGLVDDKRELSLNGMLTFFQRIPAYRAEVEKAISECKEIGTYLGIRCVFFLFRLIPGSIACARNLCDTLSIIGVHCILGVLSFALFFFFQFSEQFPFGAFDFIFFSGIVEAFSWRFFKSSFFPELFHFDFDYTRLISFASRRVKWCKLQPTCSVLPFAAKGDNCEYAYTFNKCYAELSPRVSVYYYYYYYYFISFINGKGSSL